MDIQQFVEVAKRCSGGTFAVSSVDYEWEISEKSYPTGYQVGVRNLAQIPVRRDGQDIHDGQLFELILEAVSVFYYGNLLSEVDRWLGLWVENEKNGDATLYIDETVWVADKLSANIVGAVLGEKEIYDWANDKCLTVVKSGN